MSSSSRPIRVCFSLSALYPLFQTTSKVNFGGSEVRCKTFMDGLSRYSEFEISGLVIDDGQPEIEQFRNITLYRHPRIRSSHRHTLVSKILYKLGFRAGSIDTVEAKTYDKIDSDIYCTFGVSDYSARLVRYSKLRGRKMVLFLGSDSDIQSEYLSHPERLNTYGSRFSECLFTLKNSDLVIAQTETQQRLAFERFGIRAVLIRNPFKVDEEVFQGPRDTVLWVGKSDEVKRPEIFCKLAEKFQASGSLWTMVLNQSDPAIFRSVDEAKPSNVKIIERVNFNEIKSLFDRAIAFVNTSVFEGYPNTFLQAGNSGAPIFSLSVDPDGFISRNECGFYAAGSLEGLADQLQIFLQNTEIQKRCSRNVREYVVGYHDEPGRIAELRDALVALKAEGAK